MTITDPRGDPSLLQTVVRAEHARLEQLLEEARRDTSGTPGVHEHLVQRLQVSLTEHLNAEMTLVHPEVRTALTDDDVEELIRDTRDVRQLLEQGAEPDLEQVGHTLRRHIECSEALLAELRTSVGGRRMATLGLEYGRVAEASPGRIPPTRQGPDPSGDEVHIYAASDAGRLTPLPNA